MNMLARESVGTADREDFVVGCVVVFAYFSKKLDHARWSWSRNGDYGEEGPLCELDVRLEDGVVEGMQVMSPMIPRRGIAAAS